MRSHVKDMLIDSGRMEQLDRGNFYLSIEDAVKAANLINEQAESEQSSAHQNQLENVSTFHCLNCFESLQSNSQEELEMHVSYDERTAIEVNALNENTK
jgi:hypothetical protein